MLWLDTKLCLKGRSSIAQWLSYLLLDPAAPGSITGRVSGGKIVDGAEVNQRRCLEESGQWLDNVDQTHLILAYD